MDPQEVGRILDEIGKRIGPAGEYAWNTLVTGERVLGFTTLFMGIVLLGVTYVGYRLAKLFYDIHQNSTKSFDSHDMGAFGIGVLTVLVLAGALICIGSSLPSIIAPEYVVLTKALEGVR